MRVFRLIAAVAVAIGTVLAVTVLAGTVPVWASSGSGWVRLAHLSPNAPAVDVYLYSFDNPEARLVLRHVSYGMVSPYQELPAGDYTVSMRAAGTAAASPPVLSTSFWVSGGDAYTVAGMGPAAGLRLQVIDDSLAVPPGRALVRVIQASLRQHVLSVSLGQVRLARDLPFASTSAYQAVTPGAVVLDVTGTSEHTHVDLSLAANSVHTLMVLDGASGLRVTDVQDAAGSQAMPRGGAATGLGGTAPRPAQSPLPWLALIVAGALLAGALLAGTLLSGVGPRLGVRLRATRTR